MKNSLSEAATSGTNIVSGKGGEEEDAEEEEGISAKRRKLSHDYDGKSSQLLPTRV